MPGAVPLTLAKLLVQAVARVVEFRRPGAIIVGHLHQNLAAFYGSNRGFCAPAKVHGVGLLFKWIFAPAGLVYAVAYGKGHLAGQQQHGTLFFRFFQSQGVAGRQLLHKNVHKHIGVDPVHLAQGLAAVLVKIRTIKHRVPP